MYKFFTFDTSIKVGDYVFSGYHEKDIVFQVTEIKDRFITQEDYDRYQTYRESGAVGDAINPLVQLKPIANLSIRTDSEKKVRASIKSLDGGYLIKVTPELINEHIIRMEEIKKLLMS